jgi:small subunit ribosomal protein S6
MRRYELMVILDPDLEEKTVSPSLERMAFEINKKGEGIYAVIDMQSEPAPVKELDRQLNLNESVLRTKVVRPE